MIIILELTVGQPQILNKVGHMSIRGYLILMYHSKFSVTFKYWICFTNQIYIVSSGSLRFTPLVFVSICVCTYKCIYILYLKIYVGA